MRFIYCGVVLLCAVHAVTSFQGSLRSRMQGGSSGSLDASDDGVAKIREAVRGKAESLASATADMWTAAMQKIAEEMFTEAVDSASIANEAASQRDAAFKRVKELGASDKRWKEVAIKALLELEPAAGESESELSQEIKSPDEFLNKFEHLRERQPEVKSASDIAATTAKVEQQQSSQSGSPPRYDSFLENEKLLSEFKLPSLFD